MRFKTNPLTGKILAILVLTVVAGCLLFRDAARADTASAITVRYAGSVNKGASLLLRSGMVDLASLLETFDLRSSMEIIGDRLDLVGENGSCRLLIDSPLILSRGLFAVMSGPLHSVNGRLALPTDFLTRALPALTGRSVSLNATGSTLELGEKGSGRFEGRPPGSLERVASFIRRDQYIPEEAALQEPRGLSVVVLDPGHGGRSIGAQGSTGTLEKELVLSVAEKLKNLIEEGLGIKVVLTRTADYYVGLKERTAIANNNGANLFLSIHANATFRRDIDGFETYYLNLNSTDRDARKYAEMENKALGIKGDENDKALLEAILWDLAQTAYLQESSVLASMVQKSLVSNLKGKDRGVRKAPLAVLMGARMPASLVEIGYISNPEQEVRLNRDSHQEQIARALYRAVESYHRGLLRGEIKRTGK
ncbi:MAG: N-acetylmuramoyl-L-alanine amidase [bacterium]|nr:N-acetylmuramoyl-L-alanine amidase [bacterium]MDT8396086.1 N-acetylmuramoyl-L-alanine amidase [bacterium]